MGAIPYHAIYILSKGVFMSPISGDRDRGDEADKEPTKQDIKIRGIKRIIDIALIIIFLVVACIVATYFMEEIYRIVHYGG